MIQTQDFLFELGCEELPPLALSALELALGENLRTQLQRNNLTYTTLKTYATPRRLAVLVTELSVQQPNQSLELKGPNLQVAFDKDGKPTPACLGFMRSNNVELAELKTVKDNKGEYVGATKNKLGENTIALLPTMLMQALKNLPIPRVMRWGNGEVGFARPVHWIVMLYGKDIIPCEFFGKNAGNITYGHRFLASQAITISHPCDYAEILRNQGKVIADVAERENIIYAEAEKLAQQQGGTIIYDKKLLNEVACLVEYPVALLGTFPEKFLNLPSEVLILVLQQQQRYFPIGNINNKNAQLQQHFIIISNLISQKPEVVISGNEKVIVARLSDAEFFYQEDQKIAFNSTKYTEQLKKTIYQKELGSLHDKMLRVQKIATTILFTEENKSFFANKCENIAQISDDLQQIALLTKNDLMTNMVGEFPELQGIMGYYYAKNNGYANNLALPLKEQYFPRFAKDELPKTTLGLLLAIAERIDTIVGIFLVGKSPTGDKDPFALRRCAFGILNIIKEHAFDIDLFALIAQTVVIYQQHLGLENTQVYLQKYCAQDKNNNADLSQLIYAVAQFMYERFRKYMDDELKSENLSTEVFNAVLDAVKQDTYSMQISSDLAKMSNAYQLKFLDFIKKMQAVNNLKQHNVDNIYINLITICKRLNNILAKNNVNNTKIKIDINHYSEQESINLCLKIDAISPKINELFAQQSYIQYCNLLIDLVTPINNLFDNVMILSSNAQQREYNLQLLQYIRDLFSKIVNFGMLD